MKQSTVRKILLWCIILECSIILSFSVNIAFNLTILLISAFVSLLLALQKTPREEMQEAIEKITGTKYVEGLQEGIEAIEHYGSVVVRPKKGTEKEKLITKILRGLGVID